ncbi:MipA/OmpV family protein [Hoeflea sp. YIM 152468]|uniref:MipA/OmpV family protein n=1 Tax=Hoeflea sp. YIM 152468 TaxID=3031759 RepID=UPI0023DBA645|nr:MipA/OmpV family protein [Hoeflea sp. YIM 152468]MDF1606552.1 MipA/OmpV family protein [Hoeflea sp. YIM 152468]
MNKSHRFTAVSFFAAALALVPQARAQDASGPGVSFELGGAAKMTPRYFGASKLVLSPVPLLRLKRLELPNGFSIGGGSDQGFSLSPSIDVIGKRSVKESPELAGLNTIDTAVELGVAAKYQIGHFRVMGAVRRGFGGHEGIRGELGADVIVNAGDQWTFHGGPRLMVGDSKFTTTYFGVSAAEASALYPSTTAGGGLVSAGLEAGARFQVDGVWAVEAGAGWSRLTGDAARSPITAQGSKNQYSFSLGVVRRFDIGF